MNSSVTETRLLPLKNSIDHKITMKKMYNLNTQNFITNFKFLLKCSLHWLNICLLFCALKHGSCYNSMIDQYHLKEYPYCGSMYYPSLNQQFVGKFTGRVVNSHLAKKVYRWIVQLIRTNLLKDGDFGTSFCSGSVITEKYNDYQNKHFLKSIF